MTAEQWAMAGILVTLLVGLPAFFVAKTVRKNKQSQHIRESGTGYQAGRDIKIGKTDD